MRLFPNLRLRLTALNVIGMGALPAFPRCVSLAMLILIVSNSQDKADSPKSRLQFSAEAPAKTTKKALEQTVTLDLPYQPLTEVIRLLRVQSGINFLFDRQTLAQAGFNPDEAFVSLKLSMNLASGLRQILSQHSLDYAIIGDMILITTEQKAIERQLRQPVSVSCHRLQLKTVLEQLSYETATNIVLDTKATKEIRMPVTLEVEDAPLEVIVKLLANRVGLKQIRVGNVMVVTTKANAAELQECPEARQIPIPTGVERQLIDDFLFQLKR